MEENVKLKNASKGKERHQPYSPDGMAKRSSKPGLAKSNVTQLPPPQPFDGGSPVKKVLGEANKIVKIGMEKEYALLERDNILQSSNEMVDNLRKNILHLQMEYEKLDQNYQREISQRSEIIKRLTTTEETIESIMECSNALSNSLKQLEADKFKIAEFYKLIQQNQAEIEAKYLKLEKFMQEQDGILKTTVESIKKSHADIVSQHSETVSQLNRKLNYAGDKLKVVTDENEKLQKKIQEFQESSHKLETCLEQHQKLNSWLKENAIHLKYTVKKLKIQRFKYQNLWKRKKKQIFALVQKYKILKESLEKAESLYNQCSSSNKTLESKNNEWEAKFKKYTEEEHERLQNWESEKSELNEKLLHKEAELETLIAENKSFIEKFTELAKNDLSKQAELEKVQNELSKMLSENLKLRDENLDLIQGSSDKSKMISDLQERMNSSDADFISQIEFHIEESHKLQDLVNKLELQLSDMQERLVFEKKEKESAILDFDRKFEERTQIFKKKIDDLENLLEEKSETIRKLESERSHADSDNQKSVEKLSKQLKNEEHKNEELNKNLESMKESHEEIKKQLEKSEIQISDFLEKLANVNALNKALNRTQNELETSIANLKMEIKMEKKSYEALEEEHKKAEKELSKMQKISEENSALKQLLKTTEARVEAYKVVVNKLETEKIEAKNAHPDEVAKSDFARLSQQEEVRKTPRDSPRLLLQTPKKNIEQTKKKETEASPLKGSQKENEPELMETDKWHQTSTPIRQTGKRFLSTPRKIYKSPQSSFRNLTPARTSETRNPTNPDPYSFKQTDPYKFDSDSSVERLDPEKVLKVFSRQKKRTKRETNKKPKINN